MQKYQAIKKLKHKKVLLTRGQGLTYFCTHLHYFCYINFSDFLQQYLICWWCQRYGKLLKALENAEKTVSEVEEVKTRLQVTRQKAARLKYITQEELREYVAEEAMSGIFKKIADKELLIWESLNKI